MSAAARTLSKDWQIKGTDPNAAEFARSVRISSLLSQILINRGVSDPETARNFLSPKLTELIPPEKMPGIGPAVERIKQAIAENQKIAIYGDYDVDGITSVSILWQLFTLLDIDVEFYIPHRIDEGYGLNEDAITQLAQHGVNLIITVDCGITAIASADLAAELGVDLIITDHHKGKDTLPQAVAIVHPSLDDTYPNPDSAGAMVAFKLAWAVINEVNAGKKASGDSRQFLLNATTLAAMGTIADVVDLRGENRILTSFGLKALADSKLLGIRALIESANLTGEKLDSYHIAFRLAPMLNAAGRMGHARLAVELLTSDSEMRCMQIAQYLKQQNQQRQQYQRKIYKHAREMITQGNLNHPDRRTIVLANEDWHTGVIGIVASRVVDDFCRPAILINSGNGDIAQGSARSIEGFNIHEAITACSEHLESFGGHAMAAGIKIRKEKIADFTAALEEYAQENLDQNLLTAKLDIDALCTVGDLSRSVVDELKLLEPFGQGNRKPLFAAKGVKWISPPRRVGAKGDHLQIAIGDNTGSVRCIGFNMGKLEKKLLETEYFNIAFEPDINTFNGNSSVQFVLTDIQFE
ncbi:MAG TPA: single-stranded-DNA-specific exonuclease RecJ [Phycisphaerales bacterium]|nr:single-stranded-DNA-specific exonuclease RecJ [Phycisphaerales bacterium]